MTKDVSAFDSSDTTTSDRPTATFDIAGRTYEMRCPKMRVWMAVMERQEDYESGQVLKPHVQDIYLRLATDPSVEERDKLLAQLGTVQSVFSQAPTVLQLASFFLDFLASCMVDPKDAQALAEAYNSNDGAVDIPHLRLALDDMDSKFADWLDEQADLVGVRRPELPERPEPARNRADRRAGTRTTTKPAAGRKPTRAAKRVPAA